MTTGNTFSVTIRAIDVNNQIIADFNKAIKISVVPGMGTPYKNILKLKKRGVKIGGAEHTFIPDEEGIYTFTVTPYTVEDFRLQISCGSITRFSPKITVT